MGTTKKAGETRLILIGGFLGSGKTTLLWECAQRLSANGLRVGLITNDQAPELVDSAFLERMGGHVAEVSGSCFCCNFQGLLKAMSALNQEAQADVLLAEPVGSCTDLSATVIQPLKEQMRGSLVVSPLSVLVDATMLSDILKGKSVGKHSSTSYILHKQIEEADFSVISKADQMTASDLSYLRAQLADAYPATTVFSLSSRTGAGVAEWLDAVLTGTDAGRNIADVDYDIYAEGEAVLGWLNTAIQLEGKNIDWRAFATRLLTNLSAHLDKERAAVGHIKLILLSNNHFLMGNLTGKSDTLHIRGSSAGTPFARLVLNARVEMTPEKLEKVVRQEVEAACQSSIRAKYVEWQCFSPGRPNPTYRYDHIVSD